MKISMAGKYKTRNGKPVRVLSVDAPGDYPVLAVVDDCVYTYTVDGKYFNDKESKPDLIEEQTVITMDGKYRTRNGEKVRILTVDAMAPQSVVYQVISTGMVRQVRPDGNVFADLQQKYDLIPDDLWSQGDIPSKAVYRPKVDPNQLCSFVSAHPDGVVFCYNQRTPVTPYTELATNWQWSSDGVVWRDCRKEDV